MTYEDKLRGLSDHTALTVGRMWEIYQRGHWDRDTFIDLAVGQIATANHQGRSLALVTLRAYIETATREPQFISEPETPPDGPRLHKALSTILEAELDTGMQLHRLATNEPLAAATDMFSTSMASNPLVSGWRRGLESGACQLCRWWWREGRVWRSDHPMPRHTGCTCHPVPVVTRTDNYQEGAT